MGFHKAVLGVALGGVIALVFVSLAIDERVLRTLLSVLAVLPLLYVSIRVALRSERNVASERRRFMKLRNVTDEFIMNVRNLNRLALASRIDEAAPDADAMIEEVVQRMHKLVEHMRDVAGEESPEPEPGGESS